MGVCIKLSVYKNTNMCYLNNLHVVLGDQDDILGEAQIVTDYYAEMTHTTRPIKRVFTTAAGALYFSDIVADWLGNYPCDENMGRFDSHVAQNNSEVTDEKLLSHRNTRVLD